MKLHERILCAFAFLFIPLLTGILAQGCASISPTADPLVVQTERFLTTAQGTFLFTLQVDDKDRGFWRTNAPAFHNFCQTLRVPTLYTNTFPPKMLPQYRAALLSLDDVKRDYQLAKTEGNSNALYTAFATLQSLQNQAASWTFIVTNRSN